MCKAKSTQKIITERKKNKPSASKLKKKKAKHEDRSTLHNCLRVERFSVIGI